jgi:hypothetical protein
MAVQRLALLLDEENMEIEKVTSLADHRHQLAQNKFDAPIMKCFAMGGTEERAREIIEAAASAQTRQAVEAALSNDAP